MRYIYLAGRADQPLNGMRCNAAPGPQPGRGVMRVVDETGREHVVTRCRLRVVKGEQLDLFGGVSAVYADRWKVAR